MAVELQAHLKLQVQEDLEAVAEVVALTQQQDQQEQLTLVAVVEVLDVKQEQQVVQV